MIDAATVTWEPSVPRRRPRLWPTLTGLALQDVNVTMTAQLSFADHTRCDPNGPAARSLADTMRLTLTRLA